jgi:NAD+ synthase (glutamine-hydrolysing)
MKIALAQINTAMGDVDGNDRKIRTFLEKARAEQVDLTIFPELTLVGYPPRDLVDHKEYLSKIHVKVDQLSKDFSDVNFVIGSVDQFCNVAHVISGGKIIATARKNLLPNYDVFDERRYFRPGSELEVVEINNKKIAISICEDIWAQEIPLYNNDPIKQLAGKKIDFMINLSASPFDAKKYSKRIETVTERAKSLSTKFVYVNLVGGNDELIFDGGSFAMNEDGKVIAQAPFFEEAFLVVDLNDAIPVEFSDFSEIEKKTKALTLGLRDFVWKSGFKDVTLGLSGGIDSALVLLLAVEAFGKEHIHPVFMPSIHTSQDSKEDVSHMITKFHMPISLIPITSPVTAFAENWQASLSEEINDVTLENLQSRMRGTILMSYSALKKAMVINTANKSETATGYCTLYGDTIGGVCVIADLYKHEVYAMAKFLNEKHKAIPNRVFTRAPSAELKPDQKDSDRLPEYPILDPLVEAIIEKQQGHQELIQQGFHPDIVSKVLSMVHQTEFKRKQMPPVLRVSSKAFGTGRRMPIARKS